MNCITLLLPFLLPNGSSCRKAIAFQRAIYRALLLPFSNGWNCFKEYKVNNNIGITMALRDSRRTASRMYNICVERESNWLLNANLNGAPCLERRWMKTSGSGLKFNLISWQRIFWEADFVQTMCIDHLLCYCFFIAINL